MKILNKPELHATFEEIQVLNNFFELVEEYAEQTKKQDLLEWAKAWTSWVTDEVEESND